MAVTIADIAKAIGAPDAAKNWAGNISRWSGLYACRTREKTLNLSDGTHKRRMRTLGMAKRICEDWAGLLWTENAELTFGDDTAAVDLRDELFGESFAPRFAEFVERDFAKGTGALELLIEGFTVAEGGVIGADEGTALMVDFVDAERIVPLSWARGDIAECAFVSFPSKGMVEVREHRIVPGGWEIRNRVFIEREGKLSELSPDAVAETGVVPEIVIYSPYPLFAILKPAIVNNLDTTSPYGVSVFANAEDHLATVDLVWDNFAEDFELGGKMVGIPDTMLRRDDAGNIIPPQRDKQNLFVNLESNLGVEGGADRIWEFNPTLRVEENVAGLTAALAQLSSAVGMGAERYILREGAIATATQVISENSDLFRARRKHMLSVTACLTRIARAALWCARNILGMAVDPEAEITVRSDDSVIEDDGAREARGMAKVQSGVMSIERYLIEFEGMAEDSDEFRKEVERLKVSAAPLF